MNLSGAALSLWDLVEGINQAEEIGRKAGEKWLERDKEEWEEIDRALGRCKLR